ncbi:hypothetical protein JMJ77_0005681 [Colletotrichum scovillei]|uniref:Uncharacterized protein n=1 Tax=Colletotrichum scovillei TaxID=1209932 RepID=A0A9P7RIS0_9PEZI|nr:hypothetical protein JMJ77_0005681 [Colletotrichum scovillei]KAG7076874.1 hypothetical protein JMJ76_0014133 [Colletotrichum scovillei]KAG7084020.1 hypothetical protein JMJ78_0009460 [Colletotrichum scovillei]
MELAVIAHRKGHEQELLALPVAFLYPWHITREHADLVHWIGFFDQTNSDSGARNRRCLFGVKSGGDLVCSVARSSSGPFLIESCYSAASRGSTTSHKTSKAYPHKMKRSGGGSSGGNTASCRKQIMYFSVVANDFLSLSRCIATADKRTCTRSGRQLRCLTPSIGVSQQWKCQSESQIQVPGRTGERHNKSVSLRRTPLSPIQPDLFRARDDPILHPGITLVRENGGSCFA